MVYNIQLLLSLGSYNLNASNTGSGALSTLFLSLSNPFLPSLHTSHSHEPTVIMVRLFLILYILIFTTHFLCSYSINNFVVAGSVTVSPFIFCNNYLTSTIVMELRVSYLFSFFSKRVIVYGIS